jgi:hypothetical protein
MFHFDVGIAALAFAMIFAWSLLLGAQPAEAAHVRV